MPYRLAFTAEYSLFGDVVEWFVDGFFTIDIIITFFSAYEEEDGYV